MSNFFVDTRFAVHDGGTQKAFRASAVTYRGANPIIATLSVPLIPLVPTVDEDERPGGSFAPERKRRRRPEPPPDIVNVPFSEEPRLRRLKEQRRELRRQILQQVQPEGRPIKRLPKAPETPSGLTAAEERRVDAAKVTRETQQARLRLAQVQAQVLELELRRRREIDNLIMILLLAE